MPLVFVHGVSNRDTPEYRDNQFARDAFLRELVVPALDLAAETFQIFNPYWGDEGVKFRWANASLPETASDIEAFGVVDPTDLRVAADALASAGPEALDIVAVAKRSLTDAIDLVWAAALPMVTTPEQGKVLAQSYKQARLYATSNPKPEWLATAKNSNFVDQLLFEAEKRSVVAASSTAVAEAQWESFGAASLGERLKEAAGRISALPGSAMSSAVLTLGRKHTHLGAAQFLGDVFQYLERRGERSAPGPIVNKVLGAFRLARSATSPGDKKLVVVAHSLGGVISYDILTYFDRSIEVDVLVTVGSQVALFEEMALYRSSRPDFVPNPASDRLPLPANVKRWINVLDPNDVFSFRADGVFDGVKDFVYETGFGVMSAHSGYFRRPSFYERLGRRLAQADG
jgi:hypothetical protein